MPGGTGGSSRSFSRHIKAGKVSVASDMYDGGGLYSPSNDAENFLTSAVFETLKQSTVTKIEQRVEIGQKGIRALLKLDVDAFIEALQLKEFQAYLHQPAQNLYKDVKLGTILEEFEHRCAQADESLPSDLLSKVELADWAKGLSFNGGLEASVKQNLQEHPEKANNLNETDVTAREAKILSCFSTGYDTKWQQVQEEGAVIVTNALRAYGMVAGAAYMGKSKEALAAYEELKQNSTLKRFLKTADFPVLNRTESWTAKAAKKAKFSIFKI